MNPVAFKMSHRAVTAPRIQAILETLQGLYEARVTDMQKHVIMYSGAIISLLSEVLSTIRTSLSIVIQRLRKFKSRLRLE